MSRQGRKYLELRDKTVRKANELIQKSRFSLSVQQQKIILYLISQISAFDEEFRLYEFNIIDFCKVAGIDFRSGNNYADLKEQIQKIADKSIWIRLPDGRGTLLRWIERPYINEKTGIIQIKLDELMKPYLLQLKQNFTSYELKYTLMMRSKYSIRLYELIKSIHFHELQEYKCQYSIDELRQIMDAQTYSAFRDFHARALRPAVDEINAFTDKNISYEQIKIGKKTLAIEFTISSKDSIQCEKIRNDIDKSLGTDQLTLWDDLVSKGYAIEKDYE